ncbi:MAG: HD domain-containing protein [Desulfovermiculus sp.]
MDIRHKETKNHTDRVTQMAVALARKVGVTDPQELECIKRGSILHDIGKIGTPDQILIKPGKLTPEEWATIKKHFDPEILDVFLNNYEEIKAAAGEKPFYDIE